MEGFFKCKNEEKYINVSKICDGIIHCENGNDEISCFNQFLSCPIGCKCTNIFHWNCSSLFIPKNNLNFSYFSQNNLKNLEIQNLRTQLQRIHSIDIKYLKIINCNLGEHKPYLDMPNLVYLNLQKNNLRNPNDVMEDNFKILQYLDLSFNPIEKIYFTNSLKQLLFMDLSFTSLHLFKYDIFKNLNKLKIFKFIGCKIIFIEQISFKNLKNLEQFYINSTELPIKAGITFLKYQKNLQILVSDYFPLCCYFLSISHKYKKCTPSKTTFSSCSELLSNNIVRYIFWIIGSLGFIGNTMSISFRCLKFRRSSHLFYLLLSISDLLTSSYLLSICIVDKYYSGKFYKKMTEWYSSTLCKCIGCIINFSLLYSMFNLLFISWERYYFIIIKPNGKMKSNVVALLAISFFVFSTILASFPVIYYKVNEEKIVLFFFF